MGVTVPLTDVAIQIVTMALLGLLGQAARSGIGIYKLRLSQGDAWKPDWKFTTISLVMGAVIGVIGGALLRTTEPLVLIPLGYAGVDALEGLLNKRIESAGITKG